MAGTNKRAAVYAQQLMYMQDPRDAAALARRLGQGGLFLKGLRDDNQGHSISSDEEYEKRRPLAVRGRSSLDSRVIDKAARLRKFEPSDLLVAVHLEAPAAPSVQLGSGERRAFTPPPKMAADGVDVTLSFALGGQELQSWRNVPASTHLQDLIAPQYRAPQRDG